MKKFTDKVQRLGQRANEIKQAIEGVPPKIVGIRDAVVTATGHVQKLRADILASVSTLRAETDAQLVAALREIDSAADILHEAGCELAGVDLDLGPARKVRVYLKWQEEIDADRVRALHQANAARPTIAALLAALIKADELSEKVQLEHLRHATITVEIGLVPSVRIGWRAEVEESEAPPAVIAPELPATPPSLPSEFKSSTFFERAEPSTVPAPASAAAAPVAVIVPETAPAPAAGAADDHRTRWQSSALDRFKKMPDLTKRSGPAR